MAKSGRKRKRSQERKGDLTTTFLGAVSNTTEIPSKILELKKESQIKQDGLSTKKRRKNREQRNKKDSIYSNTMVELAKTNQRSEYRNSLYTCSPSTCIELQTSKCKEITSKAPSFKERLQNKLESGKFRWINEKLYTSSSKCASELFEKDPALFNVYHQGFSSQVEKWPVNPVDVMIGWIKQRSPNLVVVDMGCGEAKISQNVPNKVYSFDLVAANEFVTICDMAQVPLPDNSAHVVIFCLSLMGTNLNDFLKEAHRILRTRGVMKVAEVVSRFHTDMKDFEQAVSCLGFRLKNKDTSNKMFVQFEFIKSSQHTDIEDILPVSLKPCLYKKR